MVCACPSAILGPPETARPSTFFFNGFATRSLGWITQRMGIPPTLERRRRKCLSCCVSAPIAYRPSRRTPVKPQEKRSQVLQRTVRAGQKAGFSDARSVADCAKVKRGQNVPPGLDTKSPRQVDSSFKGGAQAQIPGAAAQGGQGAPSIARRIIGDISPRVTTDPSQYWVALQPFRKPMSRIFCTNRKNGCVAGTSVKYGVVV